MKIERELMRGAGPTAVLKILSARTMYGYELVEELAKRTDGVLAMGQSTLYPMLYNLEAKGLAPRTVGQIVWRLSSILDAAVADRLIPSNPAKGVRLPPQKPASHSEVPLTLDDAQRLADALQPRLRAMFWVGVQLGHSALRLIVA